MLEGKNKDGGAGGGGVLLCRRVMIVSSLCIKSGWFHDLFFFFSVYRQLGSNKQASKYISCKILLLKILYNQNNQRNGVNLLNPSIMSYSLSIGTHTHTHAYARANVYPTSLPSTLIIPPFLDSKKSNVSMCDNSRGSSTQRQRQRQRLLKVPYLLGT